MSGTIRHYPDNQLFAYPTKGKAPVFPAIASGQAAFFNMRVQNNSGGAANLGILKRFFNANPGASFSIAQYTAVGPVVTDVTAPIGAGTATEIFTTTNNDGFIVSAKAHFGMVGFNVSTAQAGLVLTVKYWNGSSYVTLTTLETANFSATGNAWIVFQPPNDWMKGGSQANQSQYSILVQATTAGAGNVNVNDLWVAKFLELVQGVANNGQVQISAPDSKPILLDGGESFIPYFSVAAPSNQAAAYYGVI